MNIDYANTIPMRVILRKIGLNPQQTLRQELLFQSPITEAGEMTLIVNTAANTWYEFSLGKTGNVISFVCEFLRFSGENCTTIDALRWLKNMVGYVVLNTPKSLPDYSKEDASLEIREETYLSCPALINYLEKDRKIPFENARFLLKELKVFDSSTKRTLKALGFQNEEGGYFVRSPYFKSNVHHTATTFIRGKIIKPSGIHIFKDVFDFLSFVSYRKGESLSNDTILLNSFQCMKESSAYIRNYGYQKAFTWFDNSDCGNDITAAYDRFIRSEPNLKHVRINPLYRNHKDVNEWWIAQAT
jgi:hypothetical protein